MERHVPHKSPNPRTISQFRREVIALLRTTHQVSGERGLRLLARHDDWVQQAWRNNKPPCYVADHLAGKLRTYVGRDAERPAVGETYQSKAGTQWMITSVNRDKKRVKVKKTGFRDLGELEWNPSVLRQMKQLQTQIARQNQAEGPVVPTQEENPSAYRSWLSSLNVFKSKRINDTPLIGGDLDGAARRYHVYVIESVHENGKRVLYVGQSAHTPAQRLRQHKQGKAYCVGCTKRSYAKGTKMRLVPEFYKGIPTIRTRQRAEQVERILARKLRSLGFNVEGGH